VRRLVVHMHTTLNNRVANADGGFWEPFAWDEDAMAYLTGFFRTADTWALSRTLYEAIVPWWETVARGEVPDDAPAVTAADREFAGHLSTMTKVVFSRTLAPSGDRVVLSGDLAEQLAALKQRPGKAIILSCGPATLAALASAPGLVDEYLIAVHPAATSAGPRLFDGLTTDLGLRLLDAEVFDGGCVVLRYEVAAPS
jgi:dihydrofolate reductase